MKVVIRLITRSGVPNAICSSRLRMPAAIISVTPLIITYALIRFAKQICSRTRVSFEHYTADHFNTFCKICNKLFLSSLACAEHIVHSHSFCLKCKIVFKDDRERRNHYRTTEQHRHSYCSICDEEVKDLLLHLYAHVESKEGYHHQAKPKVGQQPKLDVVEGPPNHYRTLGIDPSSPHEDILRAAKRKRIETHPDRFTKDALSPKRLAHLVETSKNVGWAASVLCDPSERQKYDAEMGWNFKY